MRNTSQSYAIICATLCTAKIMAPQPEVRHLEQLANNLHILESAAQQRASIADKFAASCAEIINTINQLLEGARPIGRSQFADILNAVPVLIEYYRTLSHAYVASYAEDEERIIAAALASLREPLAQLLAASNIFARVKEGYAAKESMFSALRDKLNHKAIVLLRCIAQRLAEPAHSPPASESDDLAERLARTILPNIFMIEPCGHPGL